MKSAASRSSNKLQWLDSKTEHQDNRIVAPIMVPRVTCPIMTSLRFEQVYQLHHGMVIDLDLHHTQHQLCSYGCSSVRDTVIPAAMDAPVSVTLTTLQLWMFQCHGQRQSCSHGCSSVTDAVSPAAMDDPVTMTVSILQLWMLQCPSVSLTLSTL